MRVSTFQRAGPEPDFSLLLTRREPPTVPRQHAKSSHLMGFVVLRSPQTFGIKVDGREPLLCVLSAVQLVPPLHVSSLAILNVMTVPHHASLRRRNERASYGSCARSPPYVLAARIIKACMQWCTSDHCPYLLFYFGVSRRGTQPHVLLLLFPSSARRC